MFDRSQLTLEIAAVTLVLVMLIVAILLYRGGRSREAKEILDAVRRVDKNVEGARGQMSAEHPAMQADVKEMKGWLSELRARFGFLKGIK